MGRTNRCSQKFPSRLAETVVPLSFNLLGHLKDHSEDLGDLAFEMLAHRQITGLDWRMIQHIGWGRIFAIARLAHRRTFCISDW